MRFTRERDMLQRATLFSCAVLPVLWGVTHAADRPYRDDPAITELLDKLGDQASAVLPAVTVEAGDLKMHGMEKYGPGQRDYCNKMVYAPDRQTALYAGGNHQVPHRMNDVWEYHLGSNTCHVLYAPDGGNIDETNHACDSSLPHLLASP